MLQREAEKRRLAELLAATLHSAGVNHAFVHGLDEGGRMGRDLDILVQADQLSLAVEAVRSRMHLEAWRLRVHRRRNGHFWCFAGPSGSDSVLEFDLFPRIRWGPSILVDRPEPLEGQQQFSVDPWAGFVKRILVQLLGDGAERFRRSPERLVVSAAERVHVPPRLRRLFGASSGERLWAAIEDARIDELTLLVPSLRRMLLRRSISQPPRTTVLAMMDWFANEWASRLALEPLIPVVALAGGDSATRRSLARAVAARATGQLPAIDVEVRAWPSERLVSPGWIEDGSDRTTQAPSRSWPSGGLGPIRLVVLAVDHVIESFLARRDASRLKLVVYERGLLDVIVDPRTFVPVDNDAYWLLLRLSRPNLVILLIDDAASTAAQELDPQPRPAQNTHSPPWLELVRRRCVDMILPLRQPADTLACQILGCAADWMLGPDPTPRRPQSDAHGRTT
jgi:hypothetical protein